MFAEELEDLKNRFMSRLRAVSVLSGRSAGRRAVQRRARPERSARRFSNQLLPPDEIDEAFICGPAPMMDAAEGALKAAGLAPEKVHVERFGTPLHAAGVPPVEITEDTPAADLELDHRRQEAQAASALCRRERRSTSG